MEYRGYLIEQDKTGYAPKDMQYHYFSADGETYLGSGESLEYCKRQIDELWQQ